MFWVQGIYTDDKQASTRGSAGRMSGMLRLVLTVMMVTMLMVRSSSSTCPPCPGPPVHACCKVDVQVEGTCCQVGLCPLSFDDLSVVLRPMRSAVSQWTRTCLLTAQTPTLVSTEDVKPAFEFENVVIIEIEIKGFIFFLFNVYYKNNNNSAVHHYFLR